MGNIKQICSDTHQFLDATSCHPYHCKKVIPYRQALKLDRICSNNENFNRRCNDLEKWLMKRVYNKKKDKKADIKCPETF